MANGSMASRVCLLMDQHLSHYTERKLISDTKEMEKYLLISLSQVLKDLRRWTSDSCSDSSTTSSLQETEEHEEESSASLLISGCEYRCLERIIADLIGLLGMKTSCIQHLAGSVLVELSEILVESGRQWDGFIQVFCECAHSAIVSSFQCPALTSAIPFRGPDFRVSDSHDILKPKLKDTNWHMVSGIFRVLCNISKRLNQEENIELLGVFFNSVCSILETFPWGLLDESSSHRHGDGEINSQDHAWALGKPTGNDEGMVFLGRLVQLLCSLVRQSIFLEDCNSSELTNMILPKVIDLVPNLLRWCCPKLESQTNSRMSGYLAHKLLVLMIRLSYYSNLSCATLLSWLQCLHLHFQGFLQGSITISRPEPAYDSCLDSSPFLSSFSDAKETHKMMHPDHLQRLVIFLFLRCSFTLINSRRHIDNQCELDCRKKGIQETREWIEGQIPGYTFPNQGTCLEKHIHFSLSFVQLYMHEDDLLFKVLLQLLSVPLLHGEKQFNEEKPWLQDEEQTVLFYLSVLFNPVKLFCLFLSELHYDHQVLLDYLISKDTGTSCAEYLLRCLRTVCNSWSLFVEFHIEERAVDIFSSKRRKISVESPKAAHSGKLHCAIENVKSCLLSLKSSIENLHHKKLFPYNPEALLKRLQQFQELCLGHE